MGIETAVLEQDGIWHRDLADVVEEPAALERGQILGVETERFAEPRRVVGEALAVAVRAGIARFDRRTETEDDRFGRLELVGEAFQPHERLNARVQLRGIERLDQKVVAAGLDALQSIGAIALRGDDHDRHEARRRFLLQAAAHVEAFAARRDEIDEHEIGRRGPAGIERLASGQHHRDVVSFFRQDPLQKPSAGLVVVGYENRRA